MSNDSEFDYSKDCQCDQRKEFCESVKGNAFDIELRNHDCEVRVDMIVNRRKKCVRLWGQVKDCEGIPVEEALVKLLKPRFINGKIEYEGVAHTQTDCLGFYQFEVCAEDDNAKFRVIVGKASKGHERTIGPEHGICNPCKDRDCT